MDYRIRDLQEKPYMVWNDNFIVDNGSTIGKLGANALRNYCKDRLVHVSNSAQTIKPGVYYVWDNAPSSITITFENESNAFGNGEFLFQEFYFCPNQFLLRIHEELHQLVFRLLQPFRKEIL